MRFNGPWCFAAKPEEDNYKFSGQIQDKDGNALASIFVKPNGIGSSEALRNAKLCAMAPELVDCLEMLVMRIKETPFDRNEELKKPMLRDAVALLKRVDALEDRGLGPIGGGCTLPASD